MSRKQIIEEAVERAAELRGSGTYKDILGRTAQCSTVEHEHGLLASSWFLFPPCLGKGDNEEIFFLIVVGRMGLALWKDCEGSLRRHADGMDTGDSSTIDFTDMSFLCYHWSVRRKEGMWEIQR